MVSIATPEVKFMVLPPPKPIAEVLLTTTLPVNAVKVFPAPLAASFAVIVILKETPAVLLAEISASVPVIAKLTTPLTVLEAD